MTAFYIYCFLCALLLKTLTGICGASKCNISYSNGTTSENFTDNSDSTVGVQLNENDTKSSQFRVDIKICINGSLETVCDCASIPGYKITCRSLNGRSTACLHDEDSNSFKITLRVSRFYTDIVWEKFIQNSASVVLKHIVMQVSYLPSIKSLTVNGQEENNGSYLVDKGQNVTISCSYDGGNPPVSFHLVDVNKGHLVSANQTGHGSLQHRFIVSDCSDEWPKVMCVGDGVDVHRTVAILVRCSPRFSDTQVSAVEEEAEIKFNIRSYTPNISECRMSRFAQTPSRYKKVKCIVSGSPPDLLLTLNINGESWVETGMWRLTVEYDLGTSDTIFELRLAQNCQHCDDILNVSINLYSNFSQINVLQTAQFARSQFESKPNCSKGGAADPDSTRIKKVENSRSSFWISLFGRTGEWVCGYYNNVLDVEAGQVVVETGSLPAGCCCFVVLAVVYCCSFRY